MLLATCVVCAHQRVTSASNQKKASKVLIPPGVSGPKNAEMGWDG